MSLRSPSRALASSARQWWRRIRVWVSPQTAPCSPLPPCGGAEGVSGQSLVLELPPSLLWFAPSLSLLRKGGGKSKWLSLGRSFRPPRMEVVHGPHALADF